MEDNLTILKDSIINGDLATASSLVSSLDANSMRNLLDQHINGENCISLALRCGHQEIATQMLIKSTYVTDLLYEDFSWLKLFALVGRRTSSGQLIRFLKYAAPFVTSEHFPLSTLGCKPKFLKTAFALGAVCTDAKGLGQAIMDSMMQYRTKLEVLAWLVENKHVTSTPLSYEALFLLFRESAASSMKFLQSLPHYFFEQDSLGNTILHYATQNCNVRLSTFNKIWRAIKASCNNSSTHLIAAACQPNNKGEIPAILYLAKYLGDTMYPIEFVAALGHMAQTPELCTYLKRYAATTLMYDTNTTSATILFLHVLHQAQQSGQDIPELRGFLQNITLCDDFSTLAHFMKKGSNSNVDHQPANETTAKMEKNSSAEDALAYFTNIPSEIFQEIVALMAPHELTKLFSCSKKMKADLQLMFEENETFWHKYHHKHFLQTEKYPLPYRTVVQQTLKAHSGWRQNKYSTLELTGKPLLMDENWMILSSKWAGREWNSTHEISYWNCHSQQISDVITRRETSYTRYHTFLKNGGYVGSADSTPKFLIYDNSSLQVVSGADTALTLKNGADPVQIGISGFDRVTCLTENLLFTPQLHCISIYDIERQEISASFPRYGAESVPNRYNSTFVSFNKWDTKDIIVTDWKSRQTITLPKDFKPKISFAKVVDEHTLFFSGMTTNNFQQRRHSLASCGWFIDLRTGKNIFSVNHVVPREHFYEIPPTSNDRIFLHSQNWPLVTCWNGATRKFEWIEPTEYTPRLANSRYLVLDDKKGNVFVRDYTSW